jgi:hypothetical protein
MSRPNTNLTDIDSQNGNWDQTVDANNDKLESLLFAAPVPISNVHIAVADEGSTLLTGYAAASYAFCIAIVVDPATPATNGHLIYSDGSNWIYSRSGNTV